MEAQVAATQPHAGTQSQRPTGTQAYEPAAQKLTPREADADQGAEDEPSYEQLPQPFVPIEELQNCGISMTDIKKCKDGGFATVKSLLTVPKKTLIELKGLSDAKVDKMLEACAKILPTDKAGGFVTATEFMEIRKDTIHIKTGAETVDAVLGGGVCTRSITELYGEWRTGKTQLCHTLAVTTQLPIEEGGGCAKVAWIDTEGTFCAEKIVKIADRFNLDAKAVLDNILVARTFTHEMMRTALIALTARMSEEPFKLLVIDSIMAHFRVDFTGRGELSERQQKLGQFLSMLNKLADEFNVAVVYTNQVQADPSGMSFAGADPKKAIGGHVLAHASHVRCAVRKGRAGNRVLKVVDAPNLKEAEGEFEITDAGIQSADS